MRAVVVYNSQSGSALNASQLRQKFDRAGIDVVAFIDITDDFKNQLRPWTSQSDMVIAVVGGDGTISSVAGELAGRPAVLAPLPGGTLNHFTRDLGIPQDIDQALAGLADAAPRKIDVAKVNDRVFVNNSSLGLYPASLRMRKQLESTVGKWPAAAAASLRALIHYRTYTVTIRGETFSTPFLFVGNNDYHLDNPEVFGRRDLSAGELSVYAVASASRLSLVKVLLFALMGRVRTVDELRVWHTDRVTIHTNTASVSVSFDGEVARLSPPLEYKVIPGGLTVIGSW